MLSQTFPKKRNTQSVAEAIDKNGVLIFGLLGDCSLACYNTGEGDYGDKKYSDTILKNKKILDYINGIKVGQNFDISI